MFFCILFVFFSYFFCVFLQKNTRQIQKIQKIRISKIQNIQKKYESTISKIQNTKKIQTQNFKNTKYKEKTNSKINQRANPVFTVEIRKQIAKKNTKPTTCIFQTLQFWFCIVGLYFFRIFFVFWNVGRRPFCSHRGQLKSIYLSI